MQSGYRFSSRQRHDTAIFQSLLFRRCPVIRARIVALGKQDGSGCVMCVSEEKWFSDFCLRTKVNVAKLWLVNGAQTLNDYLIMCQSEGSESANKAKVQRDNFSLTWVYYLQESVLEVGPLQLFQLTSLQSGQEGFVIIRQLTAVDWLSSFFPDKPNLQLWLL